VCPASLLSLNLVLANGNLLWLKAYTQDAPCMCSTCLPVQHLPLLSLLWFNVSVQFRLNLLTSAQISILWAHLGYSIIWAIQAQVPLVPGWLWTSTPQPSIASAVNGGTASAQ
jgi:hypothetical protein